ncbi:MAG: PEP-CTERM sorting domain-containing protein [Aquabacterium sp.]
MYRIITTAALLASAGAAQALTAGSFAFVSFNADEDGWALVALENVAANSTIYFTDNTWNGSSFAATEAAHQWNTGGAAIAAGTVVRFSKVDSLTQIGVSVGTLSFASSANLGLNATNETIYAYTSNTSDWTAPTTFLAAVSSAASGFGNATFGVLTNTGLAAGMTAIEVAPSADFAQYTGARAGEASFGAYLPLVNASSAWSSVQGGDQSQVLPDMTAFSVVAVPEPQTYALLLAGLGAIGMVVGRRQGR